MKWFGGESDRSDKQEEVFSSCCGGDAMAANHRIHSAEGGCWGCSPSHQQQEKANNNSSTDDGDRAATRRARVLLLSAVVVALQSMMHASTTRAQEESGRRARGALGYALPSSAGRTPPGRLPWRRSSIILIIMAGESPQSRRANMADAPKTGPAAGGGYECVSASQLPLLLQFEREKKVKCFDPPPHHLLRPTSLPRRESKEAAKYTK